MKVNAGRIRKVHDRPYLRFIEGNAAERILPDPKDGELCLNRAKPEETLVEARSGSDVNLRVRQSERLVLEYRARYCHTAGTARDGRRIRLARSESIRTELLAQLAQRLEGSRL